MDYAEQIDAETWAFIRKTESFYTKETAALDAQDQRAAYDRMCAAFRADRPAGVNVADRSADGVAVRIYTAGDPTRTVVYFHGGGFVVGGLDSHDDVCAEICAQTGYRVVSVDYRLAPEHKSPAAFDDAWCATKWVADEFRQPLVVVGDSAGGRLAASVAHRARGRALDILGQVLIYPGLGGDVTKGSYVIHAQAPMLTLDEVLASQAAMTDPDANPDPASVLTPLRDSDFSNLPPTVIISAEIDPVADDGAAYRDAIQAAAGRAEWINETGLVHGYLRARHSVKRAHDSFERIVIAIEALGQGLWPYD